MPLATLSYIRLSVIVPIRHVGSIWPCTLELQLCIGGCIEVGTSITWVIGDHCRITPGSLPCGSLIALDMHALLSERKKKKKKKKKRQVGPKRKVTKPRGFCTTVTSADQIQFPVPTNPCETHRSITITGSEHRSMRHICRIYRCEVS